MYQIKNIKNFLLFASFLLLTACNGFFEKDNTPYPAPLVNFSPQFKPIQLWSTRTGGGTGGEYLKMSATISPRAIYTASTNGMVTAVDKRNGTILWQVATGMPINAGPGAGDGVVVVASRLGDIQGLSEDCGASLWKMNIPGQIMSQPAISHGVVIVKTTDGAVVALSILDGHEVWSFQEPEPNLILRASSSPIIKDQSVFVGFANGNLAKFSLMAGQLFWIQPIAIPEGAFSIQRMIDIDANPVVHGHHVYAATYQGKIARLDWVSGQIRWSHDISSYTGMIATDDAVYISDAKSHVWSFNTDAGFVNWRQNKLLDRNITGPAVMGCYVVVGDAEGYLHWLDRNDGHFAARANLRSAIYAAPIVENDILYVLSSNGDLTAYIIG